MNLVFEISEPMVRNNDESRVARQPSALQYIQDLPYFGIQESHGGETRRAHRTIFMVRIIQGEEMEEQKVRFVLFQNLFRGGCPDFVLPGLAAVLERV